MAAWPHGLDKGHVVLYWGYSLIDSKMLGSVTPVSHQAILASFEFCGELWCHINLQPGVC